MSKDISKEKIVLNQLRKIESDEFKVFYEPKIYKKNNNVLRPDFIFISKKYGVFIVEMKNWNIEMFNKSGYLSRGKHYKKTF
jgi:predicted nuclease of restriction endonuclease-like RecB superfamily